MAETVKESICNAGDPGSMPGLGRTPGEGNGNPLQYSCLGEFHGQRSLMGYCPWDLKRVGYDRATKTFTFKEASVAEAERARRGRARGEIQEEIKHAFAGLRSHGKDLGHHSARADPPCF